MKARVLVIAVILISITACATVQPLSPGAPRRAFPYPAILAEQSQRAETVNVAWAQLALQQGVASKSELPLQPITATIRSLPENFNGTLYLPKVGSSAVMNEEETRESLRRFLNEWKPLLGTDASLLTLVTDSAANDGTRTALYEQRPFTYPLRGDYGKVTVQFAPDRRILNVSSTAIPDSERIQTALNAAVPQIKAEDVAAKLLDRAVNYQDSSGNHVFTITSGIQVNVQQLVIYVRPTTGVPPTMEFRLAWEIALANAPVAVIYLDALQDEIITPPSLR
jgi:hypothetical protein